MEHEHLTYPEASGILEKYHIEIIEKERSQEEIDAQNERRACL